MMDDFERQIRDLREFDFHNEELRQETDKKKQRAIVLAHYDTSKPTEKDTILFQKEMPYWSNLDAVRMFKATIHSPFSLVFENSERNKKTLLEVQFDKKSQVTFFD